MRRKTISVILMCILLCTACGKKAELHEEPDVQPVEVTETSSEEDEINENEEFTNTDTFNDYVEVEYEPDEYVAIEDDKPDYSGIYMDLYGTQIANTRVTKVTPVQLH